MALEYTPRLGRRIVAILFVTQSLASAGYIATITINPLVAAALSGNAALAGVPGTLMLIGAAIAAYPAGRLMQRSGRRMGLVLGFAAGVLGMLVAGGGIVGASFLLYLLGLFLVGASRGVIDQSRYAAADAQPLADRARAISTLVFASTVGGVGGPALVAPLGKLVQSFGLNPLVGALLGGAAMMLAAGIGLAALLRPDPRDIALALAAQRPDAERAAAASARPLAMIVRRPAVLMSVGAMVFGQAIMVLVMTVTSLHMSHHHHGLEDISLVIAAHILGMFGVSFLTGYIADRIGRPSTIGIGAALLFGGALLAPVSLMTPWVALALFLVGFGWNMCYIGGSSLLADSLAPAERGQVQGLSDLAVNFTAAGGSLASGFIMADVGYGLLCVLGAELALVLVTLLAWYEFRRVHRPRDRVVSADTVTNDPVAG